MTSPSRYPQELRERGVRFITVAELVMELSEAQAEHRLSRLEALSGPPETGPSGVWSNLALTGKEESAGDPIRWPVEEIGAKLSHMIEVTPPEDVQG